MIFSFKWNLLDIIFGSSYERYIWIHKLFGNLSLVIGFIHG